jgi:membrane-associated PAP2 superfamily phosphatase
MLVVHHSSCFRNAAVVSSYLVWLWKLWSLEVVVREILILAGFCRKSLHDYLANYVYSKVQTGFFEIKNIPVLRVLVQYILENFN